MIVAFRVDSSAEIGSGHVMRCLALAEALKPHGADVTFVCRRHDGDLVDVIRARGFDVEVLAPPSSDRDPAWGMLGVPWEQDARDTLDVLPAETAWLVVDHYALDAAWESRMRDRVPRILVMDDLADRRHDCDALLDPTYPGEAGRYRGLVPPDARLLLGPRYAQMAAPYAEAAGRTAGDRGEGPRLLVFYGGTDVHDLTGRTLRAITGEGLRDVPAEVVLGATNPHRQHVEALARERRGTTVHAPQPALADLMAACSLAASAGGVTLWERLCVGLPGVVVSLAENQVASCTALAEAGLTTYLGGIDQASEAAIAGALQALLDDPEQAASTAERGQAIVDGLGARRVAEVMLPTPARALTVRLAGAADRGRYFGWANDPTVRRSALTTRDIAWDEHRAWFAARLADGGCHLLVLEADGLPVGQARFDLVDGVATLDYSIDAAVRGRGWGVVLLGLAIADLRASGRFDIVADVRSDNAASVATLMHAGFRPTSDSGAEVLRLRLQGGDDGVAHDADLVIGQ
ncbi:MAG: hypothetical protein QG661_2287 [Actinomycetota bacterium]|jgi:UDP-2,4-diacetamido-2,4,6-trideoxy-beta-L-altropyranose hydrolase|nr:hypothetical protein [Actinomycetota bacterium]